MTTFHAYQASLGTKQPISSTSVAAAKAVTATIELARMANEFGAVGLNLQADHLIVLDLDHKDGNDGVQYLQKAGLTPPLQTYFEQTANGSYHFFYRLPANLTLKTPKINLFPGVDLLTEAVIIAPSQGYKQGDVDLFTKPIQELPMAFLNDLLAKTDLELTDLKAVAPLKPWTTGALLTALQQGFTTLTDFKPLVAQLALLVTQQAIAPTVAKAALNWAAHEPNFDWQQALPENW